MYELSFLMHGFMIRGEGKKRSRKMKDMTRGHTMMEHATLYPIWTSGSCPLVNNMDSKSMHTHAGIFGAREAAKIDRLCMRETRNSGPEAGLEKRESNSNLWPSEWKEEHLHEKKNHWSDSCFTPSPKASNSSQWLILNVFLVNQEQRYTISILTERRGVWEEETSDEEIRIPLFYSMFFLFADANMQRLFGSSCVTLLAN